MSKLFGVKEQSKSEELMQPNQNQDNSNLDINLVLACFQEKLTQIMTELVVKEATIKQLMAQIDQTKGK